MLLCARIAITKLLPFTFSMCVLIQQTMMNSFVITIIIISLTFGGIAVNVTQQEFDSRVLA